MPFFFYLGVLKYLSFFSYPINRLVSFLSINLLSSCYYRPQSFLFWFVFHIELIFSFRIIVNTSVLYSFTTARVTFCGLCFLVYFVVLILINLRLHWKDGCPVSWFPLSVFLSIFHLHIFSTCAYLLILKEKTPLSLFNVKLSISRVSSLQRRLSISFSHLNTCNQLIVFR